MIYELKIKVKSDWDWRGYQWLTKAFFHKKDAEERLAQALSDYGHEFIESEIVEHKYAKKGIYVGRGLGKRDQFVRAK